MHLTILEVKMQTLYDEQTSDSMQLVVKRKRVIQKTKTKNKKSDNLGISQPKIDKNKIINGLNR